MQNTNQMIARIILAIILGAVIGYFLPLTKIGVFALRGLITFSDIVSSFLAFFVPVAVLTMITPSIIEMGGKASRMLIMALVVAFLSFVAIGFVCLLTGYQIVPILLKTIQASNSGAILEYKGFLPPIIEPFFDVITAMALAFTFGIAATKVQSTNLMIVLREIEQCSYKILSGLLIPILPFYIFGIIAKFSASGELFANIGTFGLIILLVFIISNTYIMLVMFVLAKITKRSFWLIAKAYLPVYLVGFATRSSKATILTSIGAAETIEISKEIREFGVPFLATAHMLGDMAMQIFGAVAFYYIFMGEMLPLSLGISYVFLLSTLLMAAPGTPGGAVVTTKPFLTSFLGLPPSGAETFFAVGITNDSFATGGNVLGDGAILMILEIVDKNLKS
jgi:Na+/H+-dicarboxylate symporter